MQRVMRIGVGAGIGAALLIVIVVVAVTTGKGGDSEDDSTPWNNVRLPESIRALGYKLDLDIDFEQMQYTGVQEASLNVTKADTRYLLIHTKDLVLNKTATTVHDKDGTEIELKETFMGVDKDPKLAATNDFYVVEVAEGLAPGVYKLTIPFAGKVQTSKLTGLYRSSYKKDDSTNVYQISTDFEPVDARSAFPCLDEPAQKATWTNTITVRFPKSYNLGEWSIISNAPQSKQVKDDKAATLKVTFEESIEMSTYLVCFAVTNFGFREGKYTRADKSEVLLRVWARRETEFQNSLDYALKVTPAILSKYEEFYGVNYPLKKLDQIAFPQFNSGAMENWGIITYRESSLLYNSVTSSQTEKQRVCAVIAHEVAHQWFGNIVTMAWWNDLWLNEGFASFVEYYGIANAEPDWNILDFFYPDEIVVAMNFDSSPSSHPISVTVSAPEELNGLFDTISYRKGSSINWMMQNFLGETDFRAGLAHYIQRYRGGNAAMVDLFEALNEKSRNPDLNVTEVMLTWTEQMGFPYVTVKLSGTKLTASQTRYLRGEAAEDDTHNYQWHVPFTFIGKPTGKTEIYNSSIYWLKPGEVLEITLEESFDWVKGNAGASFYYISNYATGDMWSSLAGAIKDIPAATDRTSLLYDAFSMAKVDKLDYKTALDMTKYVGDNEKEYVVMSRALSEVLGAADLVKDDDNAAQLFRDYIVDMLEPTVGELGFTGSPDEPITTSKMRDMALRNYLKNVRNETNEHVVEALNLFGKFVADPTGEKPNIKDIFITITRTAILYDTDDSNWDAMWDLLQASEWEADQKIYIAALARTNSTEKLDKMVDASFEEKPKGDCWRYLSYISSQGGHLDYAWATLKDQWDEYAVRYNSTSFTMGYLIEIPADFDTEKKYQEVKEFFDSKSDNIGTGLKTVSETLATIKQNIEKKKKYGTPITEWITSL